MTLCTDSTDFRTEGRAFRLINRKHQYAGALGRKAEGGSRGYARSTGHGDHLSWQGRHHLLLIPDTGPDREASPCRCGLACRRASLEPTVGIQLLGLSGRTGLPTVDFARMTASGLLRQAAASIVVVIVFALIYLVAARAGQRLISRMGQQGEPGARAATLWSVIRRLLLVVLSLTGLLTVFSTVWNLPLTPFVAVGSAVGIAIGLGAQQLIRDVVAGFFILLEDQYRIGDIVTLAATCGDVEEIRLRVTIVRDGAGNVHYIPNGEIRVATNMTRDYAQVVLDITVGFETDVDRVIAVLGDEIRSMASDPGWEDSFLAPPEVLGVEVMSDTGVVVRVTARVQPADRWKVQREALRRIKKRLDLEGIVLPWNPIRLHRTEGGTAGSGP